MDDLTAIRELLAAPPPSPEVIADGRARLAAAFTAQTTAPHTTEGSLAMTTEPAIRPEDDASEAAGGTIRTGRRHEPARGRSRKVRWAAVGVGLLGAAAAVTIGVTSIAPVKDPGSLAVGRGALAQPTVTLSAKQILLAAATSVARTRADGEYWVQSGISAERRREPGGRYMLERSYATEVWVAQAPGKPTWRISQDLGAKPATPEDEKAWRAAGSPTRWTFPGKTVTKAGRSFRTKDETLRSAPGEKEAFREDGEGTLGTIGDKAMTRATLSELPTTPEGLRSHLEPIITGQSGTGPLDMDAELYQTGVFIIMHLPVSPEVRAAAYRMIAALPGVTAEGEVTDLLGRTGQAISRPRTDAKGKVGGTDRLVVDTGTGEPLEVESSNAGEDTRSYDVVKKAGWTDEAPELPAKRKSAEDAAG